MLIIPAIDIRKGKTVRLERGDYTQERAYSLTPVQAAQQWVRAGASKLHVIDLDGAREGGVLSLASLKEIISGVSVPIEFGGGVRNRETIATLLEEGIAEIILGTAAVTDEAFLKEALRDFQDKIIVSIDAEGEDVRIEGWTKKSGLGVIELARMLESKGVTKLIFTDISRDGMLEGPGIENIEKILAAVNIPIFVAGGISSLEDIIKLKEFENRGLAGVVVGKALYEGRIDLEKAIEASR